MSFNVSGAVQTALTPPIIITGMHRSGTSLAASLLQSMGVNIGDELVGPMRGNVHGHFEDVRFMEFQEQLMLRQGAHWGVRDDGTAAPLTVGPAEIAVAQQLIEQNAAKVVWGWKDPRTSILLPLWGHLVPDARFLFLFRHPAEVVASLLRRGQDGRLTAAIWPAFRAWAAYNSSILRFIETGPRFWLVANIDTVLDQLNELPHLFERYLGLPRLQPPNRALIQSQDFHNLPASTIETVERSLEGAEPAVMEIYSGLLERARERGMERSDRRPAGRPAVVASPAERQALAEHVRALLTA